METTRPVEQGEGLPRGPVVAALPPLAPWAVGIAAGILLNSRVCTGALWPVLILGLAALMLLVFRSRPRAVAIAALAAGTALGALLHHRAFHLVPADHIVHYCQVNDTFVRVTGRVLTRPQTRATGFEPFRPWQFAADHTSFVVAAESIETPDGPQPVSGKLRVTVKEPALNVGQGIRVELFGELYRPSPPRNPGQYDWALRHRRAGMLAGISCDNAENVRVVDRPVSMAQRLRDRVRLALLDDRVATGDDNVPLLDAMILGRRAGMDREIEEAFVRTGCAHYLAVSGIHVGMLALFVWGAARFAGLSRRRGALAVFALVVLYALVADPRPPIIRAAIMTAALCLGLLLGRRPWTANALALAAIAILAADPTALFDVGFQLSFTAVASILFVMPVFSAAPGGAAVWWKARRSAADTEDDEPAPPDIVLKSDAHPSWARRVAGYLGQLVAVSLTAWLTSLPIVAYYFGRVAAWGWVDSLVAFPLVFAVMVLGFLKLAVGLIVPVLGPVVDAPLDVAVGALSGLLNGLARIPGTVAQVAAPPWWLCAAYYAVLAALATWRVRWISWKWAAGAAGLLAVAVGAWLLPHRPPEGVRVTQLAVGRGTSTVIELPDGQVWLYDAGASGSYDPGAGVIVPYLRSRGIDRVAGIIISHANLDHFSGLLSVVDMVDCGPVYVSPLFEAHSGPRTPARVLLDELRARGHAIEVVDAETDIDPGGGVYFDVLWPVGDAPEDLSVNDSSLVIRMDTDYGAVLLTGDAGDAVQDRLVASGDVAAEVLTLPHHGSMTRSLAGFVRAVRPEYIVRSSFVRNAESADVAAACGERPIWNTADLGAVTVELGVEGIEVRGHREGYRLQAAG